MSEHTPPKEPKEPTPQEVDSMKYWSDPGAYTQATATDIWSYSDTGHNLSVEEQLFCRSYIVDRQPVAAMRRLGHAGTNATLLSRAKKHLANPEVASCVEVLAKRIMDKLDITAEQVQRRIAEVAFFDPREVVQFNEHQVAILDSKYWTEAQARNIKGVKVGANGVELSFHDSLKASEMLAKQLNLQPNEGAEAAAAAMKAAAGAVVDKIFDTFDRVVPESLPSPPPTPDDVDTKH